MSGARTTESVRYFLTGATGFIGGCLARQLRDAGHEVVAIARRPERAGDLEALGVEVVRGDITDPATLREPMTGADGVFHLAAWYEVGTDPSRAEAINVHGTRNVLQAMQEARVPKGVYTSTLAVNSDTGTERVNEGYRYDGPHLSVYDETKWRAHYEVAVPFQESGMPVVIVMPGAVYGPGDTSQLGGLLEQAAAGERIVAPGEPTGLCWAHVEDVARGHVLAMERGRPGATYIIAGPCHSFREGLETAAEVAGNTLRAIWVPPAVLKALAKVMPVAERLLPIPAEFTAEAMRVTGGTTYYGDNTKARRELGYDPRPLREGLRDTFVD